MPKYFFHFFNGTRWIKDIAGQDLEDVHSISIEAKHAIIDMAREFLLVGKAVSVKYEVYDLDGQKVYGTTLTLIEEGI